MEYGLWQAVQASPRQRVCRLNPCSNGIWSLTERQKPDDVDEHVLILVLMEYGLWLQETERAASQVSCLNPCSNGIWSLTLHAGIWNRRSYLVLILVLMEYGLWHWRMTRCVASARSLNPCSNGIWSLTGTCTSNPFPQDSLNPCSNGIWSLTNNENRIDGDRVVLILVLMEYGLWRRYRRIALLAGVS